MPTDLIYFKFKPSQWENGSIQMLSREEKGLFMDLCSMYWSRTGCVPFKLAIQKLCNGNAIAFNNLISEEIIHIEDDNIVIKFLDEQLEFFKSKKETNSRNARARWDKVKKSKQEKQVQDVVTVEEGVFMALDELKKHYLSNTKVIESVLKNAKNGFKNEKDLRTKLDIFTRELSERGVLSYSVSDYYSYFRNYWAKKHRETQNQVKTSKLTF